MPSRFGSLATPIEPAPGASAPATIAAFGTTHAVYGSGGHRIEAAAASSCGRLHTRNEDAHSRLRGSGRLFVVADGVGGGAMASLASRLLVAHLHAELETAPIDARRVSEAVQSGDRVVQDAIARLTERPGAATVVLAAPTDAEATQWLLGWVGDCRAYRWSPHAPAHLLALSRDDTFANRGEPAPPGGSADDPARMVGNGATDGASVGVHSLAPGELLALCSDGVHKHLDAAHWHALLSAPLPLPRRCERLLQMARDHGSVDDATLLLVGHVRARSAA